MKAKVLQYAGVGKAHLNYIDYWLLLRCDINYAVKEISYLRRSKLRFMSFASLE